MTTLPDRLEPLAEKLLAARRDVKQITGFTPAEVPANTDEAYAVHRAVINRLGWTPLGWKIAGTTTYVQQRLGLDGPIYGRSFTRHRHQSGVELAHADLLDPLVECEFFVTLAKDLPPRAMPWSMADIIDATGTVHVGIEVAECRIPDPFDAPTPIILADGSAAGRYVFGPEVVNWRDGLGDIGVRLEIGGETIKQGRGADVMGDPLAPVLWLAEEFRSKWNEGLSAGDLISTGSMTGMVRGRAGQSVRAIYDGIGDIDITFAA